MFWLTEFGVIGNEIHTYKVYDDYGTTDTRRARAT